MLTFAMLSPIYAVTQIDSQIPCMRASIRTLKTRFFLLSAPESLRWRHLSGTPPPYCSAGRLLCWLIRERNPLKHFCLGRIAVDRLSQCLHRQPVRDSQRQLADHLPGVCRHQGRPDDLGDPSAGVERCEPFFFTIDK